VPRSYAGLEGEGSAGEGSGATGVSPELPRPSTEFESPPLGESYEAILPSTFRLLTHVGEPGFGIEMDKLE
jgi:hypothetical protein